MNNGALPSLWRRILCRVAGHRWADGGSSFLRLAVCLRCGKIGGNP